MADARTWVARLRWGMLVIALLSIGAAYWLEGRPGLGGVIAVVERGFLFAVLAILSVMVLGLMLHFFGSLRRPVIEAGAGDVLLKLHGSRIASVAAVIALLCLAVFVIYGLNIREQQGDAFDPAPLPLTLEWKAVIAFFTVVWALLLMAFLARAVRNPPWFVLTTRGFLYQTGDVSPGLIRWEDVVDIREDQVVSTNREGGPTTRMALVVTLRDGDRYAARYNPVLGAVVRFATGTLRAQTGGSGDLYLDPTDFGARYEEIKALMLEHATGAL